MTNGQLSMTKKPATLIIGLIFALAFGATACTRNTAPATAPQAQTAPQAETAQASTATATAETPFTFEDGTITGYTGTATTVVIPSQIQGQAVTKINPYAFSGKGIISVTIPNGVTSIEHSAFYENQLTSITIPDSVTYIQQMAFITNELTSITIGANVELGRNMGDGWASAFDNGFDTFYRNNGKQAGTYTLNNGVWSLSGQPQAAEGQYDSEDDFSAMFYKNPGVITITAYKGNKQTVRIPPLIDGYPVTSILDEAFYEKGITGVTIPDSVTNIGNAAFYGNQLTSVIIPNSVTTIGGLVFAENQITSITIGKGVEFRDYGHVGAFDRDDEFERVYYTNKQQAGTYTLNNGVWTKR